VAVGQRTDLAVPGDPGVADVGDVILGQEQPEAGRQVGEERAEAGDDRMFVSIPPATCGATAIRTPSRLRRASSSTSSTSSCSCSTSSAASATDRIGERDDHQHAPPHPQQALSPHRPAETVARLRVALLARSRGSPQSPRAPRRRGFRRRRLESGRRDLNLRPPARQRDAPRARLSRLAESAPERIRISDLPVP
jgi:hypothetical protein